MLLEGKIIVWHSSIPEESDLARILGLLSNNEKERASKLPPPRKRQFCGGRALVRLFLTRHSDARVSKQEFKELGQGKPFLDSCPIKFSISHTPQIVGAAFCLDQEVGYDLEQTRSVENTEALMKRFFPSELCEEFKKLESEESRQKYFIQAWSSLEAVAKLKATSPFKERLSKQPTADQWSSIDGLEIYSEWIQPKTVQSICSPNKLQIKSETIDL